MLMLQYLKKKKYPLHYIYILSLRLIFFIIYFYIMKNWM